MFSLGKYFAAADAGLSDIHVGNALSRQDVVDIGIQTWQHFFKNWLPELLSCFDQSKLKSLLGEQVNEHELESGIQALAAAIDCGDRDAVALIMRDKIEYALYELLQNPNSEIHEIKLFDEFPPEAEQEYVRLAKKYQRAAEAAAAIATAAPRPTPKNRAPRETPEETCIREFRELRSPAWKAKWLDNAANRVVADSVAGRL